METFGNPKRGKKYCCQPCDYFTDKIDHFNRHLQTIKHSQSCPETVSGQKGQKGAKHYEYSCDFCNKIYKTKSGLWKHNQVCKMKPEENENTTIKQMMSMMIKQQDNHNRVLEKIVELAPTINSNTINTTNSNNTTNNTINNNQKFNINVFLNEQCKNAINMSDFIKSIEVSLEQLDTTKTKGLEKGITKVIMENMSKLSVYERPMHCTDPKREILYIKDNNIWEKDNNKKQIKKAIKKASGKNYEALSKWTQENPDFMNYEDKQNYYAKTISALGKPIDDIDDKIVKNMCKQIYIKDDINTN